MPLGIEIYVTPMNNDLNQCVGYKSVLRIRIRSDPVCLGHPDPDPEKYRIWILYPQKTHVIIIFCYIKYSFVKINFYL